MYDNWVTPAQVPIDLDTPFPPLILRNLRPTLPLTNLATIWSLAHQRYTRLHPVATTSKEYSSTTHVNPPSSCHADDTPNPLPATRHLARNGSCLR